MPPPDACAIIPGCLDVPPPALVPGDEVIDNAIGPDNVLDGFVIEIDDLDVADLEDDATRQKLEVETHDELRRALAQTRTHERALAPLADRLADQLLDGWRVTIVVSALSAAERLIDLLGEYGLEANVATDPRPLWHWSGPGRVEVRVARGS